MQLPSAIDRTMHPWRMKSWGMWRTAHPAVVDLNTTGHGLPAQHRHERERNTDTRKKETDQGNNEP